ncbi:MAG TPA: hypothetical protein VJY39_04365 [Acidisphaera sp.]|nr:hypothetical protein [Acidisphaera sp.]
MDGFAGRLLLFAEDFDLPPRPNAGGGQRPREPDERDDEIARLQALLAETRDDAYVDGVAAGLAQAQAQHRDDVRRALDHIADGVGQARQAAAAAAEHAAHEVAQLLLGALGALLPELLRRHGEAEAGAVVRAILPALVLHEPAVTIRCSPHTLSAVQAELAALEDDLASGVRLIPAEELPPGDVRLAWPEGRARRSARELWSAVAEALAPLALPPWQDAAAATQESEAPDPPRRSRSNNPTRKSSR